MDPMSSKSRRAAAEAFQASLNQLQQSLQVGDDSGDGTPSLTPAAEEQAQPPSRPVQSRYASAAAFSVTELEEAVADIEQFIQDQQENADPSGTTD